VASLQFDEKSGRWRIRFYFGSQEYKRSLKRIKTEQEALALKGRVEETIMLLERGRLELPVDADPAHYILSDGKLSQKVVVQKAATLGDLFDLYQKKLTQGAKETNTRRIEKVHANHLLRLLGPTTHLTALKTRDLQEGYVEKRAKETWKNRRIKPQTIKKEIETLQAVWSWGRNQGYATGAAPTQGLTYPKEKEKPPFQTWEQIESIVKRGGLSAEAETELWNSLFLSIPEIAAVLEFVGENARCPFLYPFFVFAAHTGARKSEIIRSRVEDFDFAAKIVRIREKKRQKGKETFRTVDMSTLLVDVIQDWLSRHPGGLLSLCRHPNVPLHETDLTKLFRQLFAKSKWKVLRGYHIFRHSFASNLAAAGIDQRVIDEFMGHQTEAMRKRYRHLFPQQRRKAIESVF